MLLDQVYLFFIYTLFIELVLITVIAFSLFITLIVIMRKTDRKNTSLHGR